MPPAHDPTTTRSPVEVLLVPGPLSTLAGSDSAPRGPGAPPMYIGSTVQVHRQGSEASLRAASARMPRHHEPPPLPGSSPGSSCWRDSGARPGHRQGHRLGSSSPSRCVVDGDRTRRRQAGRHNSGPSRATGLGLYRRVLTQPGRQQILARVLGVLSGSLLNQRFCVQTQLGPAGLQDPLAGT